MPNVNIEDKLYLDIKEYCRLNKLTISVFVNDLLRKGFMVEKYDDAPPFLKKKEVKSAVVTGNLDKDGKFEQEKVTISYEEMDRMREALSPEQFELEYTGRFEPEKKKEYIKPEVISVEAKKDEKALTEREKARRRIQYL